MQALQLLPTAAGLVDRSRSEVPMNPMLFQGIFQLDVALLNMAEN